MVEVPNVVHRFCSIEPWRFTLILFVTEYGKHGYNLVHEHIKQRRQTNFLAFFGFIWFDSFTARHVKEQYFSLRNDLLVKKHVDGHHLDAFRREIWDRFEPIVRAFASHYVWRPRFGMNDQFPVVNPLESHARDGDVRVNTNRQQVAHGRHVII
jgi:hypothetical protein